MVDRTFQGTGRPYKEKGNIRIFSESTSQLELVWHRDKEDRIIYPLHKTNWKFQIDNDIPRTIEKEIFIPKGVYHRLIKGTGDLKLNIQKLG